MVQETHKPGLFKKPNKVHKTGRHRSKGAIAKATNGRESVKSISRHAKKDMGKEARRNQLNQQRANKREEILKKKRGFGGARSPPIVVAVVALQEDIVPEKIIDLLINADEEAVVNYSSCATHISISRFKQRFSFVVPPIGNIFATLDLVKIANTVLFIGSATNSKDLSVKGEVLDSWGEEIIQPIISQGLPTHIVAITNLESLPLKKRQEYKQQVQKTLLKWLPDEKLMTLDNKTDALNVLRHLGCQKQRNVNFINKRSYLLGETVKFNLNECNSEKNLGTLEVSGYLHGMPLSVNGLIHIPGFGDYQMTRIEECKDPFPLKQEKKHGQDVAMDEEAKVLAIADPEKQESLDSEVIPDPMDAEQTWPTDEELTLAERRQSRTYVKRVPKGTSAYQAAWIIDENEDEDNYEEESDEDDEMSVDAAKSEENSDAEEEGDNREEYETITISETTDEQRYDDKIDFEEEKNAIVKFKEAMQDSQFPDEIDTPQDIPAKERFQKYRGLESFRNTVWDKKENLPYDYGRIFQFENFDRTKRRILKEREDLKNVLPGAYITIHIDGVSKELFEAYTVTHNQPLIVFGILENEHKMSVLNFLLKRTTNNQNPIKSKERLLFQCGFRRFTTCPIFSEHTNGNKFKFERFFKPGTFAVATCFAPITFPPSPVLCYLEKTNGSLELIATGNVLSVNPDRIVLKRIVLSGHPFKVHKKSAVIRFMFFNPEDIRWFRPVKLRTKYGAKGHIKASLGTHGHMKCVFDRQLKSEDTILMNLYKRVFPKWTYEPVLLNISSSEIHDEDKME